MKIQKLKRVMAVTILLIIVLSMFFGISVSANASGPVVASVQPRPVIAFLGFDLTESIKDVLSDIAHAFTGAPKERMEKALFEEEDLAKYIKGTGIDASQNRIQKWFDIFELAGLAFFPFIVLKVAIMLIGNFVNPADRGEVKEFIKYTLLYIAIVVFAKDAVTWLIDINDAIVALFREAASETIQPFDLGVATGIPYLIFSIIIYFMAWGLSIYIWILLLIRKVIIGIAFMLIPLAAIMLFSKKFRGVLGTLYDELLSAIFQQAIYAGCYVILYDLLVYFMGAMNGDLNRVEAYDANKFTDIITGMLTQVVNIKGTINGASVTKTLVVLGPLGWVILMFLLIKVAKKVEETLSMKSKFAPDLPDPHTFAKSMASKGVDALGNVGSALKDFGEALDSSKILQSEKFKSFWEKIDSKGRGVPSKIGKLGYKGTRALGAATTLGAPVLAAGLAATGLMNFSDAWKKIAGGGENLYKGTTNMLGAWNNAKDAWGENDDKDPAKLGAGPVKLPDKAKDKKQKEFDARALKNLSQQDAIDMNLQDGDEFSYDPEKNMFAKKTKHGYQYFKRNENGGLSEVPKEEADKANLDGEVGNWDRYGGDASKYYRNTDGSYLVKSANFERRSTDYYEQKFDNREMKDATLDFNNFNEASETLGKHLQNLEGKKVVLHAEGNVLTVSKFDEQTGKHVVVAQENLTSEQMKSIGLDTSRGSQTISANISKTEGGTPQIKVESATQTVSTMDMSQMSDISTDLASKMETLEGQKVLMHVDGRVLTVNRFDQVTGEQVFVGSEVLSDSQLQAMGVDPSNGVMQTAAGTVTQSGGTRKINFATNFEQSTEFDVIGNTDAISNATTQALRQQKDKIREAGQKAMEEQAQLQKELSQLKDDFKNMFTNGTEKVTLEATSAKIVEIESKVEVLQNDIEWAEQTHDVFQSHIISRSNLRPMMQNGFTESAAMEDIDLTAARTQSSSSTAGILREWAEKEQQLMKAIEQMSALKKQLASHSGDRQSVESILREIRAHESAIKTIQEEIEDIKRRYREALNS